MKLIGPDVGWVVAGDNFGDHLYWTMTGGAQWKEITPTPSLRPLPGIAAVFFLDSKTGWVLRLAGDGDQPQFKLASTSDGGASWTITDVKIPDVDPAATTLGSAGHIAFADALHGWINIQVATGSAFSGGVLLRTADAGRTWARVLNPGNAYSFVVVTRDEVWITGGVNNDSLYVTRDGAKSWQTVSLPAPKEIAPASITTYDLPVFQDMQHGFEAVTYGGIPPAQAAAVLFKTDDGGSTWKPDRILTGLDASSMGEKVSSAVADSTWIAVKTANPHGTPPVVTKLSAGARVSASSNAGSGSFMNWEISFANATEGWLLYSAELFATRDGGATWSTISPGAHTAPPGTIIRRSQSTFNDEATSSLSTSSLAAIAPTSAPQQGVSKNLGSINAAFRRQA